MRRCSKMLVLMALIGCVATTIQPVRAEDEAGEIKMEDNYFPKYTKHFSEMVFQKAYPVIYREESIVYIQVSSADRSDFENLTVEIKKALKKVGWRRSIITKSSLKELSKVQDKKNKIYILKVYRILEKSEGITASLREGLIWAYSLRGFNADGKIFSIRGGRASEIPIIVEFLNKEFISREGENKALIEESAGNPKGKDKLINVIKKLLPQQNQHFTK